MNVTLAAFNLVADYPGGAVSLGPMLGKNPATLSHEFNPQYPTAKLGIEDAAKLTTLTGDLRIVSAFAAQAGCMLLPLPQGDRSGSSFTVLASMAREFADLVASVTDAAADGRTTANELRSVEREAGELVAAIQATVQHVASLMRERLEEAAGRPGARMAVVQGARA